MVSESPAPTELEKQHPDIANPVSGSEKTASGTDSPAPELTYPEGGLTAWLTVAGGSLVLFTTFGAVQSYGIYQDYYTRITLSDHTPSDVSWIGSFQTFLLFAMSMFAGKWFDEGYFRILMLAGSLIYVFSFFMLSLTQPHQYYQTFLAQGVGIGLGMGLIFLPALTISSHYFRRRRSFAMGFIFAGSSIGGVIYPIMLNRLFYDSAGYKWGMRAAAFLVAALLLVANLIMKTRLPSRKERPDAMRPNIRKIFTDGPYWICVAGAFLVVWGLFFPLFYVQLFAVLHGVPQSIAFYSITILNASSLFGRTIPNFLADSYGVFNIIIPMSVTSGLLVFALFGAGSIGGMIAFTILYGFFSGGFISLIAPALASFSTSLNEVGSRIGIALFVMGFALLTGTPITGALLQPPKYEWARAVVFSGVVVLAGSALLVVSRGMMVRRKGTWRV